MNSQHFSYQHFQRFSSSTGSARTQVILHLLCGGADRGVHTAGHLVRGLAQHRPEEDRGAEEWDHALHQTQELQT